MEKKEDLKKLVQQLIIRSENKIKSAQILLENNQFDDSISRSYHSAYLASKALLLLLGSSPKTHSGTITMLSLKAIKEGLLSEEIGKIIGNLLEARKTSDYAIFSYYNYDDSKNFLEDAKKILSSIKHVLSDKFDIEVL
ncbi:MAG: HEPN domain-containing protein [Promethearchaeota archaeon]